MNRQIVPTETIGQAILELEEALAYRLKEKGDGAFVSIHEILGVVTEEYQELLDAVHAINSHHTSLRDVHWELLDIAVACIFAIACIKENAIT